MLFVQKMNLINLRNNDSGIQCAGTGIVNPFDYNEGYAKGEFMKRISIFVALHFLILSIYAKDLYFTLNKDITIQDTNMDSTYSFKEDDIFEINHQGYGIGITTEDPLLIGICVYNRNTNKNFIISTEDLALKNNQNKIEESIKNYYWIPQYYYDQLNDNSRTSVVLKNEPCWKSLKNSTMDQSLKWLDFFKLQRFYFNDYYFVSFSAENSFDETGFLGFLEESSLRTLVYNINNMYSNWDDYKDKYSHPRPEYLPLFEKQSPYKVIFQIDGDYMNMYIDSISEKNLFLSLIRTTPEACNQIENWIKGKSNNLSQVVTPKHSTDNTNLLTSSLVSTNVKANKTMTVKENLKLRSGEATSTQVITVMQAGTKVKILELGKPETIDGISSNWVKVEVQKGAKDREGKPIKAETVGWCYGGYLE